MITLYQKAKIRTQEYLLKIKRLEGDPHFIALGLAIGVFVSLTPTIPFHTVLAVALAFLCNGSKAAAAIGVWFSNPITIPLFYYLSYRIGVFLFGISPFETHPRSILELMKMSLDLTAAMIAAGVLLGIVPGVAVYFAARISIRRWKETKGKDSASISSREILR